MSERWESTECVPHIHVQGWGYLRAMLRGLPLLLLIAVCLTLLLVLRLIERPIWGPRRPLTPFITQFVCRNAFRILGIRYGIEGTPLAGPGAVVANHSSWLDIFALNATKRIYFVSKAEVAQWPGIGWLARATGTVFIERDRRRAAEQITIFRNRLAAGHKLLFFPEGTSTDGLRVLAFKPTLFAAFFDPALRDTLRLQAVSVIYLPPDGVDQRYYGWWGDMALAPHLLSTLAARQQGSVVVRYHEPVKLTDFADRKILAKTLEDQVRRGLADHGRLQAG